MLASTSDCKTKPVAPRWPPVGNGLPVVPVSKLLDAQRPLLIRLNHECGAADDIWQEHYQPVIERMARWFHLLPASREHHHYGAGGLLAYSLETAIAAAGLFDRVIVGQALTQAQRTRYQAGLRWAAIIGGMLLDCAKPLTDVAVTGEHSGTEWNPIKGSLFNWAEHCRETSYLIQLRDPHHLRPGIDQKMPTKLHFRYGNPDHRLVGVDPLQETGSISPKHRHQRFYAPMIGHRGVLMHPLPVRAAHCRRHLLDRFGCVACSSYFRTDSYIFNKEYGVRNWFFNHFTSSMAVLRLSIGVNYFGSKKFCLRSLWRT